MSDLSLRDTLEKLRRYCLQHVADPNSSEHERLAYDDVRTQLAQILAKFPDEPAPDRQPSDAAVEAAAQAFHPTLWDGLPGNRHAESAREDARLRVRAALEAAYRVDVPRPQTDLEMAELAIAHKLELHGYEDAAKATRNRNLG